MAIRNKAAALAIAALGIGTGHLWRANRRLERRATEAAHRCESKEGGEVSASRPLISPIRMSAAAAPPAGPPASSDSAVAESPSPSPEPPTETGRETPVREILRRRENESEEQYKERVVPLVRSVLAGPRERIAARRATLEEEAGVSPDQHAELDAAIADAYQEALAFANDAIQSGRIGAGPWNWSEMLAVTAGLSTIVDSTNERVGEILTSEQREAFVSTGFDWAEYLAVSAPWETLEAPPASAEVAR